MKAKVFTVEGEVKKELALPKCFETVIRSDIVAKALRAFTTKQPYGNSPIAGFQHSARGKVSHARRAYKTHYGSGISRVPRKTMSRRGIRHTRVGAGIPGARGGPEAHPPKVEKILVRNINKKEKKLAFRSLIASTASEKVLKERYPKVDFSKISLPFVVDDKIIEIEKTKKLKELLQKILGTAKDLLGKKGVLLVHEKPLKIKHSFVDSIKAGELSVQHLVSSGKPGRLVIYTEGAISQIGKR